jgi:hypothetical protein
MSEQPQEKKPTKKVPKKKQPVSKSKGEGAPVGRVRAKTTFMMQNSKKEDNKIVAEGVGQARFSNLLSMFDKSKQPKEEEKSEGEVKTQPGKLNMNRFGSFQASSTVNKDPVFSSGGGMSIMDRMKRLQEDADKIKQKDNRSAVIDPIFESKDHDDDEDDDDEDEDDDGNLDLEGDEDDMDVCGMLLGNGDSERDESEKKSEKNSVKNEDKDEDLGLGNDDDKEDEKKSEKNDSLGGDNNEDHNQDKNEDHNEDKNEDNQIKEENKEVEIPDNQENVEHEIKEVENEDNHENVEHENKVIENENNDDLL